MMWNLVKIAHSKISLGISSRKGYGVFNLWRLAYIIPSTTELAAKLLLLVDNMRLTETIIWYSFLAIRKFTVSVSTTDYFIVIWIQIMRLLIGNVSPMLMFRLIQFINKSIKNLWSKQISFENKNWYCHLRICLQFITKNMKI